MKMFETTTKATNHQDEYNAFDAVSTKHRQRDAHRVQPQTEVEGEGEDAELVIRIRIADIAKSRAYGPRGVLGCVIPEIEFTCQAARGYTCYTPGSRRFKAR